MRRMFASVQSVFVLSSSAVLFGCGGSTNSAAPASAPVAQTAPVQTAAAPDVEEPMILKPAPFVPPAVSIGSAMEEVGDDAEAAIAARPEPVKGTVEWLIFEITKLDSAPLDRVKQPVPGKPGEFTEVELTDEQMDAEEVRRANKIVELALEICAKTKGDAQQERIFNTGVHELARARTTLAVNGDLEQAKLLNEEVETLHKLSPGSFASMEAHLKLIEMLEQLAETAEKNDTQWGKASALQARLFTKRFPKETSRGAMALVSAARACEAALLFDDARKCFTTLEHDFGKTPFAEQQAGAIRRYKLNGTVLEEFAGATIDGGFLSVDQFRGQPVLIVFWSCASPAFQQDIPRLKQLVESFEKKPFTILGVNLDTDESIVDSYLSQVDLPWRTIFSASPDQRGLKNPIARFYGVTTAGQCWVVDDKGTVLAAPVTLEAAAEVLKPFAKH